ncbi:MAG: DUF2298 domain-containing protein [Candidatus Micrarchaeota archaeon]
MLLALLVLVSTIALGLAIAKRFFKADIFPAGVMMGVLLFTWPLYLLSVLIGFSEIGILVICISALVSAYFINNKKIELKGIKKILFERDTLAVFAAAFLLMAYSAFIAINLTDGFSVATQDFAFHTGIIHTISNGNFPPQYPIFSQQRLTYYYFSHLFTAALARGGLDQIIAFQLVLVLLIASFIAAFYTLAKNILASRWGGILAILLMFIVSPCTGCQESGACWFAPFSPPNPEKMLITGPKGFPYAPTMLAFPFSQLPMAFAFLFLALFIRFALENGPKINYAMWGVFAGLLPMFQVFYYFAILGMLLLLALLYRNKNSVLAVVLAAAIGLPQFFIMLSDKAANTLSQHFLKPEMFAYSETLWDLAMFWVLNIGGHVLLAALGIYFWKNKNRAFAAITFGALVLFLIGNFFILTPYRWDSNKLFLPFLLLLALFAANGALWLAKKNKITKAIALLVLILAIPSAYYHFFIYYNPIYAQTPVKLSTPEIEAACFWIGKNTPTDSIFIADDSLEGSTCIHSLGGRLVFLSLPQLPTTHGFSMDPIVEQQGQILKGNMDLVKKFRITHLMADAEFEKRISPQLRAHLNKIYAEKGVTIYKVD